MVTRPDPPFGIDETIEGTTRVLAVRGELDLETAPLLRDRLRDAMADERGDPVVGDLVVDVAHLGFIDSTGISVLVDAVKEAGRHGGQLVLRAPTATTRRILQISGLLEIFGLGTQAKPR